MASFYDDAFLDHVRSANNIVEIISGFVMLKSAGSGRLKGLCPFHKEKTPSFTVQPDRGMYYCFGCGKGGTIFNFLMETEGISFPEAVSHLAERANITLPQQINSEAAKKVRSEKDKLFQANQFAFNWFHKRLTTANKSSEAEKVVKYLHDRGINEDLIKAYWMGWAESGWDLLCKAAAKQKISGAILQQAGLANRRKDGSGYVDRFRARVVFPILNLSGKPIAFGGRRIDGITPDEDVAKYVNSPETPIYKKGDNLYGLFTSRDTIRKENLAYLVEGYTDLLALVQAGVENVVASLGTALTPQQVSLISRFCSKVRIVYDSDTAGAEAAIRAAEMMTVGGLEADIVRLPAGDDPDTLLRKEGEKGLTILLQSFVSYIRFSIENANISSASGQSEKLKVARHIQGMIKEINDPLQKELLRDELSNLIGLSQLTLDRELSLQRRSRISEDAIEKEVLQILPENVAERDLIQAVIAFPELMDQAVERLSLSDFRTDSLRQVYRVLEQSFLHDNEVDLTQLPDRFDDPAIRAFITEAVLSVEWISLEAAQQQMADCLKLLNLRHIKQRKSEIEVQLNRAAQSGKPTRELMLELVELNEEIEQNNNSNDHF